MNRASIRENEPTGRCIGTDADRFGGKRVCECKQVRTDKLDEAVWSDACELLRHPKLLRNEYERRLAAPSDSHSIVSLKKQVASSKRSVERLIDTYTDGVLDPREFEPRLKPARERLAKHEEQLQVIETESRQQSTLREALSCLDGFCASIGTNLEAADWTLHREILRTLIDKVVVEPDQIRIVYRINFPQASCRNRYNLREFGDAIPEPAMA